MSQYKGFTYTPAPKTAWDTISMLEKSEMMKAAVRNGITDLKAIREKYNEFAGGGGIHIKPENRGKFTALKERTGHSATWFKEHGTPAQKKMATFALNARQWKHGLGGNLFDGTSEPTQQMNIMAYHPEEDYFTGPSATMPEINVTRKRDGKTYVGLGDFSKRYDRQKEQPYFVSSRTGQLTAGDAMKGIDAATGPLLHWAQPSQYVGAVRDAVNGRNPLTSMLRGNSGVVSEEYAQEHPWLSTAFNLGTDAAILGGIVKAFRGTNKKTSIPKPETYKVESPVYQSELDWSPEGWFGARATGSYDAEDIAALQSHIPEYLEIERVAKANGTWLRMPDGSMWEGEPRSWVQMQSKAYDAYTNNSPFKYQAFSHTSPHKFDTFDYSHFGETDEGFYGRGFYTHPAEKINGKLIGRNTYGDENYLLTTNVQKPFDLNNLGFEYAGLFNRQSTNAPKGLFDGYDAVYYGVPGRTMVGAFPSELVVPKPNNYKSLLGNNGNFDKAAPNIYKGLVPFVHGGGTLASFQTK